MEKNRQLSLIALLLTAVVLIFLYHAHRVLAPFFIAFALAYLLDPLVDRMEEWKVSLPLAVVFLMVSFFGLSIGGVLLIFPLFRLQAENLARNLPDYISILQHWMKPVLDRVAGLDPARAEELFREAAGRFGEIPMKILTHLSGFLWQSLSSLFDILLMVANVVIIPVVMFYLLRDFDRINGKILGLVPERLKKNVREIFNDIDSVLSGFVRGQLMVALAMAVLYSIGLFFAGTPMSLFIGILSGIASLIPYLGLVLGFVPAALLTYFHAQEWLPVLAVAGVFAAVQALEGLVLTPRLVGESIGLHAVAVMLAVLLGGEFFGFAGVLLGVPAAAVLNVLFTRGVAEYKKSLFFTRPSG
jgi:predicted PurR-regulated permease PerM